MPGPTCEHCTPLGKGEVVTFPTPSWALRLGGVVRAGLGCWRKGRGTLSWVLTILPPKYLHPLPSPCQFFAWARASVHPSSCALAPQRWSPLPSLIAQITFFLPQDSGGSRYLLPVPAPQSHPAISSLAPSLPLELRPPYLPGFASPKHTLLRLSLTSPARRPSSPPSSPFLVRSKPGQLHPPLHPRPQVHGHPSPSPCPASLGFFVSQSAHPPRP